MWSTGIPLLQTSGFHHQLLHPIYHGNVIATQGGRRDFPISFRGRFDSYHYQHRVSCWKKIDSAGKCSDLGSEVKIHEGESDASLHIQTLKRFPFQELSGKIGGSNLLKKSTALCCLASVCDGLVFIGRMAFQIMHALGYPVPSSVLEHGAVGDVSKIINLAQDRNIPILFAKDFWCVNDFLPELYDLLPSNGILNGWTPVGLGPRSLNEIFTLLSKSKKVLWIGPVEFSASRSDISGTSELAMVLGKISQSGCDVTIVGNAACKAVRGTTYALSSFSMYEHASVIWNFLKRRVLPGVAALDRAYPFELDWNAIFAEPTQPLIVDIGSGNGLFLLRMASRWKMLNFLGLEINNKLVERCLDSVSQSGLTNGYFLSTNATSTFRSIISSYPGKLVLASIQCPDPDFNKEGHRWRMLQRGLIEAIVDLLAVDGKIFLQSDIEAVAIRMKELLMLYGKGKLLVVDDRNDVDVDVRGWLKENPFGVRSDWEQHVIDRGAPMYRLMISKVMPM